MVNFRFHVVSIVAVFLALAVGIAMGTTVIDKVTVSTLRDQLANIEGQRDDARTTAAQVTSELGDLRAIVQALGDQGTSELLAGHLQGVPVVLVAVRGIDTDSLNGLRGALIDAGAAYGGTLWFTAKMALTDPNDVQQLSDVLGLASTDATRVVRNLVSRLSALMLASAAGASGTATPGSTTTVPSSDPGTTASSTTSTLTTTSIPAITTTAPTAPAELLDNLRQAGFVDWDAPPDAATSATVLPVAGARFVVVSGPRATVPDSAVMIPLVAALAGPGVAPAVAAQASAGSDAKEVAEQRTVFVGPIRRSSSMKARVSTVDDIETFFGWAAVVLALEHLPQGQVGHYGVGNGANRLLPAPVGSS